MIKRLTPAQKAEIRKQHDLERRINAAGNPFDISFETSEDDGDDSYDRHVKAESWQGRFV